MVEVGGRRSGFGSVDRVDFVFHHGPSPSAGGLIATRGFQKPPLVGVVAVVWYFFGGFPVVKVVETTNYPLVQSYNLPYFFVEKLLFQGSQISKSHILVSGSQLPETPPKTHLSEPTKGSTLPKKD